MIRLCKVCRLCRKYRVELHAPTGGVGLARVAQVLEPGCEAQEASCAVGTAGQLYCRVVGCALRRTRNTCNPRPARHIRPHHATQPVPLLAELLGDFAYTEEHCLPDTFTS